VGGIAAQFPFVNNGGSHDKNVKTAPDGLFLSKFTLID
jgi:hypothetical protein